MEKKQKCVKKQSEEYDYWQIAILGKTFLDAAQKCNDTKIECVGWSHHLIVPIITNMAFACELFLKSILKYNNIEIRKHCLVELFEKLPKEFKEEIIGLENEEIFYRNLTYISDFFEKWRYLYEYYPFSAKYDFLQNFSNSLLNVIEKL